MRDRKDNKKSHNPDPPMEHKGTGGAVAAGGWVATILWWWWWSPYCGGGGGGITLHPGGSPLHSWMAKQIAVKNKDDHIDPRSAD